MLTIVVFGVGFFIVGPLRSWAQTLFATNNARGVEFSRRVQARRVDAVRPELRQIGIDIDEPTDHAAPPEPGTTPVPPAEVATGWRARAARWWRHLRGTAEPIAPALLPQLADSAGLRPGERMFLPNGRVVHYDSSTLKIKPDPSPTRGH